MDGNLASCAKPGSVVVLTLARHRDGIWLTLLLTQLKARHPDIHKKIAVVDVDKLPLDSLPGSAPLDWIVVINRVSDAADLQSAKVTQTILRSAEIWGIPTINGSQAYSIGLSKVNHHQVLLRAGCRVPSSVFVGALSETSLTAAAEKLLATGSAFPLLVKPNAAGFGAGIASLASMQEVRQYARSVRDGTIASPSVDGLVLLQEYVAPRDRAIYRVWFLDGRVQCGVALVRGASRSTPPADRTHSTAHQTKDAGTPSSDEFTGGCSGGVCTLKRKVKTATEAALTETSKTFSAWKVPDAVAARVRETARLCAADCGSIELMFKAGETDPLYFDVNMLSTLPQLNDGSVQDAAAVWPRDGWDPWAELADFVARKSSARLLD